MEKAKSLIVSGQKRPGGPVQIRVSQHAQKLIDALCNSSFDVGEWAPDSDYSFDDCAKESAKAEAALAEYIARLEADTSPRDLSPYALELMNVMLPPYVSRFQRS